LDRQETERVNAKNALEEYVYDMKYKLESFGEFFEPASIVALNNKLAETQNWIDDEGEDQPRQGSSINSRLNLLCVCVSALRSSIGCFFLVEKQAD
jgi:hypothetical protein